jgi:membrane-associated phospholipid phosphatase
VLRWLWPLSPAIVLGMAFYVLTRFVRRNPSIPREVSLDRSVTARVPAEFVDLSHAVDIQHWAFVVVALAVCLVLMRRYRQALLLLLAEPLADGLNLGLKIAIDRQYPGQDTTVSLERLNDLLFPSGHVVRTTVTLGLVVAFVAWPRARLRWPATIAALALIGLVSVTQVAVGGHLPLDAVGGFLLGAALVNLVYVCDMAWHRRGSPRPGTNRPRVIVTEVGAQQRRPILPRALPSPGGAMPRAKSWSGWSVRRYSRTLAAAGVAVVLLVAALGMRAPQRLWHLAAEPTTTAASLPHAVAEEAGQHAGSLRALLSRLRGAS